MARPAGWPLRAGHPADLRRMPARRPFQSRRAPPRSGCERRVVRRTDPTGEAALQRGRWAADPLQGATRRPRGAVQAAFATMARKASISSTRSMQIPPLWKTLSISTAIVCEHAALCPPKRGRQVPPRRMRRVTLIDLEIIDPSTPDVRPRALGLSTGGQSSTPWRGHSAAKRFAPARRIMTASARFPTEDRDLRRSGRASAPCARVLHGGLGAGYRAYYRPPPRSAAIAARPR